ncbi:hypothetical protein DICSQDRAFT_148430 [Dichomitus squalens LYAD-421 SS1]|uniref:Uncharacterized protein n=1 Tax=Dichomitus squalens (strain LYAD-421) TaxID=732165 RepID=R7STH4_DICSQ|nr:uncharacterized protein DICSQDRAFT_148430 [Dichomitus squalens LYAD-421 SS1]EJF59529.1 hypothetical protein DICSQDRAFT_148430 [Dichomitus squalens LYAD-421 SS1]
MGLLISAPTLPRLSAVFKPPLIQSLDIDSVDMPSASVIYDFFADTAWTDRQEITHMRLTIHNLEDLGVFSNFVHRTGATFRTLYLRINLNMDILEPETPSVASDPFSLAPCAALESLVLCFCCITESVHDQIDVVLFMLLTYTGLFSEYRGELSALTHVRMDAGSDRVEVARAFITLAQDGDHGEDGEQNAHEGPGMQEDSELWTDFEDALLGLPALERVEFGFDEILCGDRDAGAIKVALESALEKRLPRLQQQGTVRVLI